MRSKLLSLAVACGLAACHHARQVSLAPLPRAAYSHYLAAKLALYKDDAATAAQELAAAAAAAPDQPLIAVEEARALAKAKRPADARAVLEATRHAWPDYAPVWLASGELLEKTAPADATRAYRRAIELERDDERAYLGLARLQDAKDAEATLRALVRRVPASVDGHYRLAQKLADRGDTAGEIAELRAVLERDPDQIDARMDLARALRRTGKLSEAVAEARSAFDRAGQPMDVAEELFGLLCEADDLRGAIDLLTLLDDERSDAEALAMVARLDIGLGRLDQAKGVQKKLAAMEGGGELAKVVGVQLDLAKHDAKAAAEHAREIESPPGRSLELEADLVLGDTARARELLASFQEPDRTLAEARILEREGHPEAAVGKLEPVIRAHPDSAAALNLAGYLLADTGTRLDDAERYLSRARDLQPGDPAILDSWGWLLVARGRTADAVKALDLASRLAPLEPEILLHLATAYARDRIPTKALELIVRAEALHPAPEVKRKLDALRVKLAP